MQSFKHPKNYLLMVPIGLAFSLSACSPNQSSPMSAGMDTTPPSSVNTTQPPSSTDIGSKEKTNTEKQDTHPNTDKDKGNTSASSGGSDSGTSSDHTSDGDSTGSGASSSNGGTENTGTSTGGGSSTDSGPTADGADNAGKEHQEDSSQPETPALKGVPGLDLDVQVATEPIKCDTMCDRRDITYDRDSISPAGVEKTLTTVRKSLDSNALQWRDYVFYKTIILDSDLHLNSPKPDDQLGSMLFLGGFKRGDDQQTHNIEVDNTTILVLPPELTQANITLRNASLRVNTIIEGDIVNTEKSSNNFIQVRSDFPLESFSKLFYSIRSGGKASDHCFKIDNTESLQTCQYPVGLIVNNLNVEAGDLILDHASVLAKNGLTLGAKVIVRFSYASKAGSDYYGLLFIIPTSKKDKLHIDKQTTFTDAVQYAPVTNKFTPKQITAGDYTLVVVKISPKAESPQERSAPVRALLSIEPKRNAQRIQAAAKTQPRFMKNWASYSSLPIATSSALSRYATLLSLDPVASESLEGTEFTQTLSNNTRTRAFVSNDNLFSLLESQNLRTPQVTADVLYLKTAADGHANLQQLSVTAPILGGIARVAINRVGSHFNASFNTAKRGMINGKKPADSLSTAYGINALLSQNLARFNPSLEGMWLNVEGAFQYFINDIRRPIRQDLTAQDKYDQSAYSLGLSLGKRMQLAPSLSTTPFVAYRFAYEHQAAISETVSENVALKVASQGVARNSLLAGATLQWVQSQGPWQGLSAQAALALSYRVNAPHSYRAHIQSDDRSVSIPFKDSKAFGSQLKLGLSYQYKVIQMGLSSQLYYDAGLSYSLGGQLSYHF